jgi:site-specific DNA-methyltransferase (adenine-specific)
MSEHRVVLGDCLGPEGLATLGDKSVDHVICDPPYEAEAHTLQRRIRRNGGRSIGEEPVDFAAITEETRREAAHQMVRVCRGWVIVFCQAEAVLLWRRELEGFGAKWRRPMIWVKPDAQPCLTGDRPGMGYESMAAAWAGTGRSEWNGGGKVGIYVANKVSGHQKNSTWGIQNEHPTQKPVDLMEALVRDFTDPGDLICDPFAGSGTTGGAAKRLGRRFIGWERDPRYAAIATKRIDGTREQLRFFEADGAARASTGES